MADVAEPATVAAETGKYAHQKAYYKRRYDTDDEFKRKEHDRRRAAAKRQYANDPAFREKRLALARERYQRKKAEAAAAAAADAVTAPS